MFETISKMTGLGQKKVLQRGLEGNSVTQWWHGAHKTRLVPSTQPNPKNAQWFPMYKTDFSSGDMAKTLAVCY